jgi:hypothetical protein
MMFVYGD